MPQNYSEQAKLPRSLVAITILFYAVMVTLVAYKNGCLCLIEGSPSYMRLAESLAGGSPFSSGYRPPLYPLLLSYLIRIFGPPWPIAAILLQALFGMLSALLIARIASQLAKTWYAGALAALLFMSHAVLQLEFLTLRETALFIFLLLAFVRIAARPFQSTLLQFTILGILAALAHLTRPTGILLAGLLLILPFLLKERKLKEKLILCCLSSIVFCASVLPWQLSLWQLTGKLSPTSSTSNGLNLIKGNNPHFDQLFPLIEIDDYEQYILSINPELDLTDQATDEQFKTTAENYIKSEPTLFLWRAIKKAGVFLSPLPLPLASAQIEAGHDGALIITEVKFRKRALLGLMAGFSLVAFFGLFLYARHSYSSTDPTVFIVSLLFALMLAAIHGLTFPESRFRYPLDALLCITAGIGLNQWITKLRRA
ncbi:MAG: glycosyltransferase family 39 protein [Bdellovibrionales bacterium]|nr:glycosyltransferase family 39 protein [Bdellovibrionales bacterium]